MITFDIAYDAELRLWAMELDGAVIGFARTWRSAAETLIELISSCIGWR